MTWRRAAAAAHRGSGDGGYGARGAANNAANEEEHGQTRGTHGEGRDERGEREFGRVNARSGTARAVGWARAAGLRPSRRSRVFFK